MFITQTRQMQWCIFCNRYCHNTSNCTSSSLELFENVLIDKKNNQLSMLPNEPRYILKQMFKEWLLSIEINNDQGVGFNNNHIIGFAIRRCNMLQQSASVNRCADKITELIWEGNLSQESVLLFDRLTAFENTVNYNINITHNNTSNININTTTNYTTYNYDFTQYTQPPQREVHHRQIKFKINTETDTTNKEEEELNTECIECSICLDNKNKSQFVKLNCNHQFCSCCVINIFKTKIETNNNTICCALCRTNVTKIITPTHAIKNEIDIYCE